MKNKKNINKTKIIIALIVILFLLFFIYLLNKNNLHKNVNEDIQEKYFLLFQDDKYGVIDEYGDIIIDPIYYNIIIPNPSKAVFICNYDYINETEEYKTKIINELGEEIFTKYEQVSQIRIEETHGNNPYEKSVLKYKKNDKYGLINYQGKQITKPIYDDIKSVGYKEGELVVKKDDKYGLIDKNGKTIVKFEYDDIKCDGYYTQKSGYDLSGYITSVKTSEGLKFGYIDNNKKEVLKPEYNEVYRIIEIQDDNNTFIIAYRNGQAGVIKNNKNIIDFSYQEIIYNDYNNVFLIEKNKLYGVVNLNGNMILEPKYSSIYFEGIYIVADQNEVYDTLGNKIEETKYSSVFHTTNDNYYITCDNNDLYGISNKEKQTLVENEYLYIEYTFDDYFICSKDNEKFGLINSQGQVLIDFNYKNIQRIENANIILTNNNTIELYNNKINKIISTNNAEIYTYPDYIKIYSSTLLKYFDLNGKEIIKNNFLNIENKNGKWGLVDKANNKTEYIYDRITDFNEYGFAGIKTQGKWGVINKEGNIVIEPTYYLDHIVDEPFFIGKYYRLYNEYGEIIFTSEEQI